MKFAADIIHHSALVTEIKLHSFTCMGHEGHVSYCGRDHFGLKNMKCLHKKKKKAVLMPPAQEHIIVYWLSIKHFSLGNAISCFPEKVFSEEFHILNQVAKTSLSNYVRFYELHNCIFFSVLTFR